MRINLSKNWGLVIGALMALLLLSLFVFFKRETLFSCIQRIESYTATDNYNFGRLGAGEKFSVEFGYHNCHPLVRGDLVFYSPTEKLNPVVRVVQALGGDRFEVTRAADGRHWNLKVNGEVVNFKGEPFPFGQPRPPVLAADQEKHDGVVPDGHVILLTHVPRGNADSSSLGLIPVSRILGRVIPDSMSIQRELSQSDTYP